ncbi:GNAT family N-acetyltransferase [Micromonospora globispora]|uniref:GNAT family N-acetyltransferase n=1 Tax=Micromonospora globispora TaxID=1450148 RepID=A0A317KI07_9ACTN|nr:GNAT family N-acetyltransferase [Micromonospora globispora]PWU53351.1 GNAT family N-acetyltransferase [Micromonospora globispora]PWU61047.1 GNAT family N-acetyltransferase [Micromonospora globispora]RQW85554.1 GNAT family N-acetyltransferase [Micromonospora globispora]
MTSEVRLRPVRDEDLPAFFAHEQEPQANWMAAFGPADPSDRAAFDAHWKRIRTDPRIVNRTITVDDEVVGRVAAFPVGERTEVSYWIDPRRWGRGHATAALAALLRELPQRPVHARAAKDNAASLAVLRKCGFVVVGEDSGYANARGAEVEEYVLELPREAADQPDH